MHASPSSLLGLNFFSSEEEVFLSWQNMVKIHQKPSDVNFWNYIKNF